MNRGPSQLDRFVSALHRRLLVVRTVEAMGRGALAGCAVGLLLIVLLLLRGVPTIAPALGSIALGALSGLTWAMTRRPTVLQAAAEADRQLHLADLLGTALTVRTRSRPSDRDDEAAPWLQSVLSMADDACRRHTAAEVILHRLNARAWGGIAVAAALVTSLAALTTHEPAARAAPAQRRGVLPAAINATPKLEIPTESGVTGRATEPGRARSQGTGPESEPPRGKSSLPESPGATVASNDGWKGAASGDSGAGGGTGRARTRPPDDGPSVRPPSGAPLPGGDQSASGSGTAATQRSGGGLASHGVVGGEAGSTTPTPPWQSPGWSDDAHRAREAIDAGRVPDSRRDLVREYFDRP